MYTQQLQESSTANGFTLIELLVVMAILSLVLMIVGPFAQQQIARSEAQAEWITVKDIFSNAPRLAYSGGDILQIQMDGSSLTIHSQNSAKDLTYTFKHVFFSPQQLEFNRHGFPDNFKVVARVRSQERLLTLKPFGKAHVQQAATDE